MFRYVTQFKHPWRQFWGSRALNETGGHPNVSRQILLTSTPHRKVAPNCPVCCHIVSGYILSACLGGEDRWRNSEAIVRGPEGDFQWDGGQARKGMAVGWLGTGDSSP